MKEVHEFRIFDDCYHLLPKNNARFNGMVYVLNISKDGPLFQEIGRIEQKLRRNREVLFSSWQVKRRYTKKEWTDARLFHFKIKTAFEPAGEECGTIYDEASACEICGANRKQTGPLRLRKSSIPKKDIARTIAGEVVASEKFADAVKQWGLKGMVLEPVHVKKGPSNYYQLGASSPELELTEKTIAGEHPFDLSNKNYEAGEFIVSGGYKIKYDETILNCPKGHLIGARLISEPYVLDTPSIGSYDFFTTRQKVGAKQGLLRPEPLYLCSRAFRNMVLEEKLKGFEFEIAHIE